MGCNLSCKRMSKLKTIRIVHLNGKSEEIDYPVTVGEVTGYPPKHVLFTHTHLLLAAGPTPLKSDTFLEPGRVYFLLPYALFDSNVSPMDFAPIARKLASIAKNTRSKSKSEKHNLSSPATGPSLHFSDRSAIKTDNNKSSKSWKPILETIRERSFTRRSESDLLANGTE